MARLVLAVACIPVLLACFFVTMGFAHDELTNWDASKGDLWAETDGVMRTGGGGDTCVVPRGTTLRAYGEQPSQAERVWSHFTFSDRPVPLEVVGAVGGASACAAGTRGLVDARTVGTWAITTGLRGKDGPPSPKRASPAPN